MRRRSLLVVLVALLLAGGLQPARAAGSSPESNAVVALIDTGINPYHAVFYFETDGTVRSALHDIFRG